MSDLGSELNEDEVVEPRGTKDVPVDDGWDREVPVDLTNRGADTDGILPEAADDGWGEDTRERELARSREAVEDAYQEPSDLPSDSARRSEFQQKVARSEAQEVQSLTEAEDYARENLGIDRVDFSDFDQRTANEVNATLEALQDKYPEVGGIDYLGSIQSRNEAIENEHPEFAANRPDVIAEPKDGLVAVTLSGCDGFDGIALNQKWANDFDQTQFNCRLDEIGGGSAEATGSVSGVVAHEFGHTVENYLVRTGRFHEIASELAALEAAGVDAVAEGVSEYASKGESELFAEAFAEYQINDNPRPAARRIGELVDKHFGI